MKLTPSPLFLLILFLYLSAQSCSPKLQLASADVNGEKRDYSTHILSITEEIDTFFEHDATYEILASNLQYADGPLWLPSQDALLFSQRDLNQISIWTSENDVLTYLSPTGYTGDEPRYMHLGSRGMALDKQGNLLVCQPGDYTISLMAATLTQPKANYLPLFQRFLKKELYGPTDLDVDPKGNIFFTDPAGIGHDFENKEKWNLPFSGVYSYDTRGKIELLNDELTVPSGIALAPDGSHIIISNGDPNSPHWRRTNIKEDLTAGKSGTIYKISEKVNQKSGLPDGLTFHPSSYLFATGPEGVWVFNPSYTLIGKILTDKPATDCTFNTEHTYLYITTTEELLRIKLRE